MEVKLRSNDGDTEVVMDLGTAEEYGSDLGVVSSFRAHGHHWDGDHNHDFFASVEGLWLRAGDLLAVRNLVAEWVRRPLSQLAAFELIGDFELARLPDQSLRLRFGSHEDHVPGGKVRVAVSFAGGIFHGELGFVSDLSCMNLFVQELSSALGRLDA